MHELIPLVSGSLADQHTPGVSARVLYDFLGLNSAAWARWAKKNIVANPYAMEHVDWEGLQLDVENRIDTGGGGRPTQDYVLALDFAKRLAMMTRSTKGEEARHYFLDCEKALHNRATLPQVQDPGLQLLIEMAVRTDEALTQAKQAETRAIRAEAKADMALDEARRMTVEHFIVSNGLLHQFPPQDHQKIGTWLRDFCLTYGWEVRAEPVYGKRWPTELAYPLQAFSGWLFSVRNRPYQIALVTKDGDSTTRDPGVRYRRRKG
mgnify:CR=1 FL=1